MAYAILNSGETDKTQVYKIAADDAEKDNLNINENYIVESISDTDFYNFKQASKAVTGHDGSNYTWGEIDGVETADELDQVLARYVVSIDQFLTANADHPDHSFWTSYKNTCETFDSSSLTYPLSGSWEDHCESAGIAYKGMLQLP